MAVNSEKYNLEDCSEEDIMNIRPTKLLAASVFAVTTIFASQTAMAKDANLVFYSSLTTSAQATLNKAIEKQFPDIKIETITAGGVSLYQRFVAERMAGKGKIDLLHFSYTPGWYHLAKEGWVKDTVTKYPEAAGHPDWAKDTKAHWVGLRAPSLQVIYNTDNVKPSEVPKSFAELITPKWKNRLVLVDPFQSAGLWDFFYGSKQFGEKYIKGLLANGTLVQSRMGSSTERVATGERDVTMVFEYIAIRRINKGAKIKIAKMKEGTPVIPASFGMIKDGPNPKNAEKVYRWVISKAGQTVITQQVKINSARTDVPHVEGIPYPFTPLFADWKKVADEQKHYREFMTKHIREGKKKK
jgi:ABC-type Fe3+ transport system substrate-binding protein